jgi:hypothetical protein
MSWVFEIRWGKWARQSITFDGCLYRYIQIGRVIVAGFGFLRQ